MLNLPKYLLQVCEDPGLNDTELRIIPGKSIQEPIFLRVDITLLSTKVEPPQFFGLAWLTISQCQVKFISICLKCKIQVTAKSAIIAQDCTFTPYDKKCECAVEIFANSSGEFTNCQFEQASKAAIAVRDRSKALFMNCTFKNNSNTSILVLDKSRANIISSKFYSAERFSIYLYRNSVSYVFKSEFKSQNGKAIFMLTGSHAHIIKCNFEECKGGGISIADSSDIYVNHCRFRDIGSSSIHAMKNSKASVRNCSLKTCKGNGVNFEYSTGDVYKCEFCDFDFPAIACFGPKATPVIYDSKLSNCHSIAIVSRDCASPFFSKLIISDVESHGFSISDFSNTVIENCILKNIKKSPFCVFNGATPEIKSCFIFYNNTNNEKLLFQTFTKGKVVFKKNTVFSSDDSFIAKIHNFGIVDTKDFVSNYYYQIESDANIDEISNQNLTISKAHLIAMDNKYNLTIDKNLSQLDHDRIFGIRADENEQDDDIGEEEEDYESVYLVPQEPNYSVEIPHKSVPPSNCFRSHLMINDQKLEAHSHNAYGKTIMPILSSPQSLPPIHNPIDLPPPLNEIDITFIMEHECQTEDEYTQEGAIDVDGDADVDAATIGHLHLGTCMRCHNGLADFVIIPCGHKVLCKKCSLECAPPKPSLPPQQPNQKPPAQPQPQIVPGLSTFTCPLCDTPIQRCTEEFVEKQCVICLDHKCDTIILPCGHRCICYECATQLWTEKKQCPLCQTRVLSFRHMFQIYTEEEKIESERRFSLKDDKNDNDPNPDKDKPDSTD